MAVIEGTSCVTFKTNFLSLAALVVAVAGSGVASAQSYFSPAPGSRTRVAILDALRPSIETELGPNIEFVVDEIGVKDGFAVVQAHPQRRGGRQIDARPYYNRMGDLGGIEVVGVLRMTRGRWNLIDRSIGATDVWWCHLVPRGLSIACR